MSSTPVQINVFNFDYNGVPAVTAAALRAEASRIRKLVKATTASIIEAGRALIAVKEQLDHGQFSDWVDAECGFSLRTAENYIRACQFAEGKNATVALLSPATVYRLAAKSTPPEVVDAVLQQAAKGEVISDDNVQVALAKAQQEKREANKKKTAKRRAETIRRKREFTEINDEDEEYHIEEATPSELRDSFLIFSNEAMLLARYEGPISDEIIEAALATASAWNGLVDKLKRAHTRAKAA